MLIRHSLRQKPRSAPIRSFSFTCSLRNNLDSPVIEPASSSQEVPNEKQKRIFLKPNQIKRRKRRDSGKWSSSTSSTSPTQPAQRQPRAAAKVDLALIQELYRKNKSVLNSSTDDDGDLSRYIETFKPFETNIGSKRYDKLTKEIDNAFRKNQIISYINNYRAKNPGLPPLKSRQNKRQIIEALFSHYWKITKQASNFSDDALISSRVIELSPAQRFLLDPKRSRFTRNLIASNFKVQLSKTKLAVSGLKSELDNIEAEVVKLNNQILWEIIDLSFINKERRRDLDFGEVSFASSSYFQDFGNGRFKISANSQSSIDTAKRLISWALGHNPHIQTFFFNKEAIKGAQLLPYVNDGVWPWNEKHAQYYTLFHRDRKPGSGSEMVFEKFDKMNDKFLKSKSLDDLVDQKLALKSDNNSFLDEALSDEILGMFKSIRPKQEESSSKQDEIDGDTADTAPHLNIVGEQTVLAKGFDLDKIVKNKQESLSATNLDDQHLNLEALRHELGTFEDDLKPEDFPDVASLIVDAEKQTADETLEILRTELGAFAEDEGSAAIDSSQKSESFSNSVEENHEIQNSNDTSLSIPAKSPLHGLDRLKHWNLSSERIDQLYTVLNDLSFANGLPGSSRKTEPYSAYTIQFGSLLYKQEKTSQTEPTSSQLLSANSDKFSFLTSIPFIKDLATSLPILYNGNQTFTNKMQIRLSPSIYHSSSNVDPQVLQEYPPVEIQADLNDWGKIKLETLQVLSIEAMNNVYVAAPRLATDLQVSKLIVGDLLHPQMEDRAQSGVSFDNQPNLARFLEDSQLSFAGHVKIKPSSSIELCVNGKFIKYDYVHLTYKTDLMFDLNGRELCLSIIEGGNFGGKRFEVILGDGELSKDEFAQFVNEAIQFCSEV
ncbi:SLS1 [Candida theae]|uniref:SLS1 n=1 Tax=Candida theae TaxID=1198502 RepID=A0AAD5BAA1_9ASCO|nr:SLS1 [Candida theae]KAI5949117.1 SLS1 [Candida theae]